MPASEVIAKTTFYGIILCWWLFGLTFWLRKRPTERTREAKRDTSSYLGLGLQCVAYFLVWMAPLWQRPLAGRPFDSDRWMILRSILALFISAFSVWLVNWAARRLGKQWALAARVVEDHSLIQDGPYALVRNPIYTGMFGLLLGTGLAFSGGVPFAFAIVLFLVGTLVRIRSEERLLREAFGSKFEDYARRVPALLPGVY